MHIKAATGPQGDHQGITSTSQGDRKGITREPCSFTRQHAAVSVTSDSPLRWGRPATMKHQFYPVLSSSMLSLFKGLAAIFSGGCDSRGASAGSSFTLDTFRNFTTRYFLIGCVCPLRRISEEDLRDVFMLSRFVPWRWRWKCCRHSKNNK